MGIVTQLMLTGFVAMFVIYIVKTSPWRPRGHRHRVHHPVAIAAWWLWVVTLTAILLSVWIPPVGAWFGKTVMAPAARLVG